MPAERMKVHEEKEKRGGPLSSLSLYVQLASSEGQNPSLFSKTGLKIERYCCAARWTLDPALTVFFLGTAMRPVAFGSREPALVVSRRARPWFGLCPSGAAASRRPSAGARRLISTRGPSPRSAWSGRRATAAPGAAPWPPSQLAGLELGWR